MFSYNILITFPFATKIINMHTKYWKLDLFAVIKSLSLVFADMRNANILHQLFSLWNDDRIKEIKEIKEYLTWWLMYERICQISAVG